MNIGTFYIPTSSDAWKEYIKAYPSRVNDGATSHFNAFTHAYCSARLTQSYGQEAAQGLGNLREFFGIGNSDDSHKQDLFNNRVGRDLVSARLDLDMLTPSEIASIIKNADDNGALALTNSDERIQEIPDDYWSLSKVKEFFQDYLGELLNNAEIIGDFISNFLKSLGLGEATTPVLRYDPLTLDLDGDGIELISLSDSNTFFDLDNDGLRENVGWVKADDGILILDGNNNTTVDNIEELFGYANPDGTQVTGTQELAT